MVITWFDSTFGVPLYSHSEVGCKMLTFMAHSCDFICVWMISWISCDRAIVLFRPGIRKRMCPTLSAMNLVIFTVLFSATLYGWCLVFAGLEPAPDGAMYSGLNSDFQLGGYTLRELHIFFSPLDTTLCTIVPSLLIMIVNSTKHIPCMKIYSSSVLRVRFLTVPPETEREEMEDTTTAKKSLLSPQSQATNQYSSQSSIVTFACRSAPPSAQHA